jgi:hypothetical protein
MTERIKFATISYNIDSTSDAEKVAEVQQKLGNIGLCVCVFGLENEGILLPTPYLRYDGITYDANEIDHAVEILQNEQAKSTTDE